MIALNAKDFQAIEHNATSLVTAIENFDARGDKHIKRLIENRIDGFYRDLLTQLCVASFAILVGSTLAFFIVRSITSSLRHITQLMGRLTKGELSVDIPQEERRDEIGSLTLALKAFHEAAVERHDARNREMTRIELERLRAAHLQKLNAAFNDSVSQSLSHLNVAVTQLNSVSQAMAQGAERASRQASEVVSAAEETSQHVQTVASASEQMSASIHAIAAQIQESGSMAQQAEQEAKQTRVAVNALSEVTTKISDVVILINQIAGQTNLLALNATIEAARAGEAGKGFAVVASEVKSLANQTARATDEIGEHIAAVQASVHNVSGAIEHIDATIMQMNKIAGTISLAVQQQNEATAEISRSVQHAASSTTEVTGNISSISEVIAESGRTAQDVLEAAKELETQTSKLKIDVSTYLTDVQTA